MGNIPNQEFDLSAIKGCVEASAGKVYDQWRLSLSGPHRSMCVKPSASVLNEMFYHSICKVLNNLRERDLKEKPHGWEIDYFLGFLQGNLAICWNSPVAIRCDPELTRRLWEKAMYEVVTEDESLKMKLCSMVELFREKLIDNSEAEPDIQEVITFLSDQSYNESWEAVLQRYKKDDSVRLGKVVVTAIDKIDGEIYDLGRFLERGAIQQLFKDNQIGRR